MLQIFEKIYYPVAYLAVGILAAILIGARVTYLLHIPVDITDGNNFYWMLLIGSQVGLGLYIIVHRQDDFWKKMVLLGFLIIVLFLKQVFSYI